MNVQHRKTLILLLQIATVSVFLGRAWQHLVWDAPFRTLLWDEGLLKGLVEIWMPWDDYITSPDMDAWIQRLIKGFGWFYLVCAGMGLVIRRWKRIAGFFMILGSISLIILAMLYCKERFFSMGQFLEYALQFLSPLFLYYVIKQEVISSKLFFYMKIGIALTFVCHGLYAIGYYPRPGYFTEMTMNILGLSEDKAIQFLKLAGGLDFLIGIGIFLPYRIAKWVLIYALLWGFLTTIARVWSYVEMDYFLETAKQWSHESIYRIPHFIIPLVVLMYLRKDQPKV